MTTLDPTPPTQSPARTEAPRGSRRAWLGAAGIAIASLAFVGGFVAREAVRTPAPPTPTPRSPEPAAEVARKLLPATVYIRSGQTAGSGVIYDAKGLILTAAHVVEDQVEVTVRLSDGTPLAGKVLGRDAGRDVAVIKVEHKGLHAAELARNRPVRVGELAVAIGSPFGDRETVTAGVVSGIGGTLPTLEGAVDVIRTDAAIHPGNSGGPLADVDAGVIGINIARRGSLGLAVPIDVAFDTASYLTRGKPAPPVAQLGVSGTDPADPRSGALVKVVEPGTPAAAAGIVEGDLITAIDGEQLEGMFELAAAIRKHAPGDEVTLTVVRDGTSRKIKVTLGEHT
ncbi:MAG: trypsin-like peptidase domain-containing protein [Actinomycetota bacterium]